MTDKINDLIDKMERSVIDYEIKPTERGRQVAEQAEKAIREYVVPLEKRVAELEGALQKQVALGDVWETRVTTAHFDHWRELIEIAHKALEAK